MTKRAKRLAARSKWFWRWWVLRLRWITWRGLKTVRGPVYVLHYHEDHYTIIVQPDEPNSDPHQRHRWNAVDYLDGRLILCAMSARQCMNLATDQLVTQERLAEAAKVLAP